MLKVINKELEVHIVLDVERQYRKTNCDIGVHIRVLLADIRLKKVILYPISL